MSKETVLTNISLPRILHRRVKVASASMDMTMVEFIKRALEAELANIDAMNAQVHRDEEGPSHA